GSGQCAVLGQGTAGLGQREHRWTLATAAPAPTGPQATGVDDRGVVRLPSGLGAAGARGVGTGRAHTPAFCGVARLSSTKPPAPVPSLLAGAVAGSTGWGTSVIGATTALASVRSVPGGTGNTAVGSPAAAHTTWNRPRSGSMITRV